MGQFEIEKGISELGRAGCSFLWVLLKPLPCSLVFLTLQRRGQTNDLRGKTADFPSSNCKPVHKARIRFRGRRPNYKSMPAPEGRCCRSCKPIQPPPPLSIPASLMLYQGTVGLLLLASSLTLYFERGPFFICYFLNILEGILNFNEPFPPMFLFGNSRRDLPRANL